MAAVSAAALLLTPTLPTCAVPAGIDAVAWCEAVALDPSSRTVADAALAFWDAPGATCAEVVPSCTALHAAQPERLGTGADAAPLPPFSDPTPPLRTPARARRSSATVQSAPRVAPLVAPDGRAKRPVVPRARFRDFIVSDAELAAATAGADAGRSRVNAALVVSRTDTQQPALRRGSGDGAPACKKARTSQASLEPQRAGACLADHVSGGAKMWWMLLAVAEEEAQRERSAAQAAAATALVQRCHALVATLAGA